jgi:acetyl/propionyl-CoA carboxylase alpha subunit
MYKILVNGKEFDVMMNNDQPVIKGSESKADILEYKKGKFHVIRNNRSFNAELISFNPDEKKFVIRVDNQDYHVNIQDKYDVLLHEMGMDIAGGKKVNDIKAPMPGMVLKVLVEAGQAIRKGEAIIVLEAMKMENVLKAASDAVVKKVNVTKGDKVEKNQVLVYFD